MPALAEMALPRTETPRRGSVPVIQTPSPPLFAMRLQRPSEQVGESVGAARSAPMSVSEAFVSLMPLPPLPSAVVPSRPMPTRFP
jgi:hypothetical protein